MPSQQRLSKGVSISTLPYLAEGDNGNLEGHRLVRAANTSSTDQRMSWSDQNYRGLVVGGRGIHENTKGDWMGNMAVSIAGEVRPLQAVSEGTQL